MKTSRSTRIMTSIFMLLFILIFLLIAGRFIYIQVTGEINGVSLRAWAKEKRNTEYTLEAKRGTIYDSNGMVLAYDLPTFRMYAIIDEEYSKGSRTTQHVDDIQKTAEEIAPLIDVDPSYIVERIENGRANDLIQVEFGKNGKEISQKIKDEIEDLELPGIHFNQEFIRHYPNEVFASHILGFARKVYNEETEKEEIIGVNGIENEMNDLLYGKDGHISYQRDRYNNKLLHPDEVIQQPEDGKEVYLTLDQKVQILLEEVLTDVEESYEPERISAIVMNAKTGEIVALSNRPTYNPNEPTNVKNWYNDVISNPFEPGSTVKMFTWAAAIDSGVYNGDELYKSGKYQINKVIEPVRDHNQGKGWGTITFDEGFQRSSNVAASMLLWDKIGEDTYLNYLHDFGLDEPTGVDLPGEISGHILYQWPREKLSTSYGQGSTVTPMQQMQAATAIANGGKMMQPYIVKQIVDSTNGEVIEKNEPHVAGEPITEETAAQVLELLGSVVEGKHGTGKIYKLDGYTVGGKTGTAEIPNPNGVGYLSGKENNIFSFLGMAPLDDPELIMYVSIQQPTLPDDEAGNVPVSYIFKNVMESALHYLDISPDKEEQKQAEKMTMPAMVDQSTSTIEEELTEKGFKVTTIGEGDKIVDTNVIEGESYYAYEHIMLLTDEPTMPSIKDWSVREVVTLADLLDVQLEPIGNGYVVKQSIDVGAPLHKEDYLSVEFKVPDTKQKESKEEKKENDDDD